MWERFHQLTISLFVVIALVGCADKVIGPQTTDLTPLTNLKIDKENNLEDRLQEYKKVFDHRDSYGFAQKHPAEIVQIFENESRRDYANYGYRTIRVRIVVYENTKSANEGFTSEAENYSLEPESIGSNRKLVSMIVQQRTDGEGGFKLMDSYKSNIVIQINHILIHIEEYSSDLTRDNAWKDDIVKQIAKQMTASY